MSDQPSKLDTVLQWGTSQKQLAATLAFSMKVVEDHSQTKEYKNG